VGEGCDDGNTSSGDGCSNSCAIESGYSCNTASPNICSAVCGNGIRTVGEGCDDGNTSSGDGCSNSCAIESGYSCNTASPNICSAVCGNGIRSAGEGCDDGNVASGDGCSNSCAIESGYSCNTASPNVCIQVCGNGIRTAGEGCDDGNTGNGDGCSATCRVEIGFSCMGTMPTVCMPAPAVCGNGFVTSGEGCDDGNLVNGDGCQSNCTVQAGFGCSGQPSVCIALCGNGVVNSGETCDDGNLTNGDGCQSNCSTQAGYICNGMPSACTTVCGDGLVAGTTEQCDDGNLVNGDACSGTCQFENLVLETEANNTCVSANPLTLPAFVKGVVNVAQDPDWFSFTIGSVSDVRIETFDSTGPNHCSGVDTVIQLFRSDCVTLQTLEDDEGGVGSCSLLAQSTDVGATRLAAGTYNVRVRPFSMTATYNYTMKINVVATCGNMVVEGSEECDGTANCSASCFVTPTCGDGIRTATEQCDDGNTVANDGCSSLCNWETTTEVEPNDTISGADSALASISSTARIVGSIAPTLDKDLFKVTVSAPTVLRMELFDLNGYDCLPTAIPSATVVTLLNSVGTLVKADISGTVNNTSGIGLCSALVASVGAGTYYVQVTAGTSVIPSYQLEVSFQSSNGVELEPNDITATANVFVGRNNYIDGTREGIAGAGDYFAITVPPGKKSVRIETIEQSTSAGVTCESNGIDSHIYLYNSAGLLLGDNDDDGRGFCSMIDGTGSIAKDAFAQNLLPGTYYVRVTHHTATNTTVFDYRLQVTIR
jgi:cysteine-rich repeat protein